MREPNHPIPGAATHDYVVHCPDVLTIHVAGRPDLSGAKVIGTDGRVELGTLGRLRVEGKDVADIGLLVAQVACISPRHVTVSVAECKSQQIYLFGQVIGLQRAVPYQGQQTVVDLLQRVGGITAGAATNDVYVVRPHLGDGKQPEVFHIDLKSILAHTDEHTNIQIQPFDEIYVGETRHSRLEKCIPRWLRPVYESLCGLRRHLPGGEAGPAVPIRRMTMDSRQYAIGDKPEKLGKSAAIARGKGQ